jgi:NAD+ kinase
MQPAADGDLTQIGVLVHPRRDLTEALRALRGWAAGHAIALGQVEVAGQGRRVEELVDARDCQVLVALGGDGTMLAALHAGAAASRPVLGIACGSVGALTAIPASRLGDALDGLASGAWSTRALPALELRVAGEPARMALNDVVVVRDGGGQVVTSVTIDDVLYARLAGDGLIVATPIGASAYTMAAGGPLLAPRADAFVITPLAPHGGSTPPVVCGAASRIAITADAGFGGLRYEVDGHDAGIQAHDATLTLTAGYAERVVLSDEEPAFTGLRRRGLLADSPRVAIREARKGTGSGGTSHAPAA